MSCMILRRVALSCTFDLLTAPPTINNLWETRFKDHGIALKQLRSNLDNGELPCLDAVRKYESDALEFKAAIEQYKKH